MQTSWAALLRERFVTTDILTCITTSYSDMIQTYWKTTHVPTDDLHINNRLLSEQSASHQVSTPFDLHQVPVARYMQPTLDRSGRSAFRTDRDHGCDRST